MDLPREVTTAQAYDSEFDGGEWNTALVESQAAQEGGQDSDEDVEGTVEAMLAGEDDSGMEVGGD